MTERGYTAREPSWPFICERLLGALRSSDCFSAVSPVWTSSSRGRDYLVMTGNLSPKGAQTAHDPERLAGWEPRGRDCPGSIIVDYFVLFHQRREPVVSTSLIEAFNSHLGVNGSLGEFTLDPTYTQFEVVGVVRPKPLASSSAEPPIPQWAIAVIVIATASLIFIVLFGAVTIYGRSAQRRKYNNRLQEDDLEKAGTPTKDWESKLAASYENFAADSVYDTDDAHQEVVDDRYKFKSPVRDYAAQESLPFNEWPCSIPRDTFDLGVVVSFGHMIPAADIEACKYGMINVHPSLLPRWRGAAPLVHTLLAGDTTSGVSVITVAPKRFDTGKIVAQQEVSVPPRVHLAAYTDMMADIGASMMRQTAGLRKREDLAGLPWEQINKSHRLCSEHFTDDGCADAQKTKLLRVVLPSVKRPCEQTTLTLGISQDMLKTERKDLLALLILALISLQRQ
ncbi:hypothetical protein HPB47_000367 [Ixodes persulcatus]|uniref:Uncharacterized protein n=1 Tax=Ixodes persulcatus TaxID=34615 RepID=A0AC60PS51_IXOPE|nr:hypothetical protein HPB47_000367 [Ixodes persulcatus]